MNDIVKLAETVQQMRAAQTEYFRTRSSIALTKSKKLEKEVDDMVKFSARIPFVTQSNMFGKTMPLVDPDLRHEIKFCLDQEMVPNVHGRFVYKSEDGIHKIALPEFLSDYRDFLVTQGIAKDYQRV